MNFSQILGLLLLAALVLVLLSRVFRHVTVFEYQHGLRFVRGRLARVLPPGSYWTVSPLSSIQLLEGRPQITTIPGQEVLSSDGVALKVSVLLETRIRDPKTATFAATSWEQSLYAKTQASLRAAISERPIDEILQSRSELSTRLEADVEPAAADLGLELLSVSIKDVMFPGSLKEAFSQTARARQEALAALERARGETAALRHLANSARMLESNPSLFQLRLLQAASEGGKIALTVESPETDPAARRDPP